MYGNDTSNVHSFIQMLGIKMFSIHMAYSADSNLFTFFFSLKAYSASNHNVLLFSSKSYQPESFFVRFLGLK